MGQKVKDGLSWVFYLVFGLLFASLVLRLLVRSDAPAFAPLAVAAGLGLLALVYRFLGRHEAWLEKRYLILLIGFLACSGIVQLAAASALRFQPVFDLGAIYDGAIQWVETGSFPSQYDYYYYFPNNLGGMAFLAVFFSLARLAGVTDYFMVAAVVNCLCVLAAILTTATVCKKQLGVKQAVFALVLFAVSLPFWFMAAVFYTDSLSMLFPVLIYYLYLKVQEGGPLWKRLVFAGLLGLAATVGMLIKFTVAIMLIAVVIDSLLHRSLKRTGLLAGIAAALVCVGFLSFQAMIYPAHLDRGQAKEINTPYLHWVMMGLKGDGGYNGEDYEFTRSFATTEERDAALVEEIGRRVGDLGPSGLYKLFWAKAVKTFGSGTYNQSDFLDDNPVHENWLHRYLLYDGEDYQSYRAVCQVVFLAILALMALSGLWEALGNAERGKTWPLLAPRLAVFGALLFFVGWETSGRYITNFVPVIFLSAVLGIDRWAAFMQKLKTSICAVKGR